MWMSVLIAASFASPPEPGVLDAVVLIHQGSTVCAGALVSDAGRIATAYHCVAPGGRPRITTRDGRTALGRVIDVDPAADLAVIDAPDLAGSPWLPVRDEPPVVGERIWVYGHPYGVRAPGGFMLGTLRWSVAEGIVSAMGPTAVQVSAPVNPGNSGGPIVDEAGQILGVVSRKSGGGEGLGFGARSTWLLPLLREPRGQLGPMGGTVGGSVFLTSLEGRGGTLSAGVRGDVAIRERVVLSAAGALPFSPRWDAVRFGRVQWMQWDARVAIRQRLFRGPFTTRLDLWVGYVGIGQATGEVGTEDISVHRGQTAKPFVGATLMIRKAGFDLGWTPQGGAFSATMVFRWPGVVSVF